jgi:hypothetical protein
LPALHSSMKSSRQLASGSMRSASSLNARHESCALENVI